MSNTQHRIVNAIAVPFALYGAHRSLTEGHRVTALYQLTAACFAAYMAITGRR